MLGPGRGQETAKMAVLSYCSVGSNRLKDAKRFYQALLGAAGITPMFEHPSGGCVYGKDGTHCFAVLGPYDGKPATVGNGSMFAFRFDTCSEVDAFHALALTLGGTDEGAPGYRAPKFYFSYFRDLDGNKLCAYCAE
jgi:catechol 2,3-dioxygenase-like lactoylglutathione lyase family enzyme